MVAGVRLELRRYSLAAKCGYDLVRSRCNVAQKSARGLRFLAAKREIGVSVAKCAKSGYQSEPEALAMREKADELNDAQVAKSPASE